MCWLDLATAYPDIWFSIILGVSVRVLPDEINFGISRLRKADGPCLVWVGLQSFETWIEQKTEEGRICSLSLTVFELGHWFSPTFGLSLELTSSVLLILRPLDLDWNCTIVSSGLPACKGCTLGLFNFPNLHEPIPYDKPLLSFMCVCVCVCWYIYTFTCVLLVLFLWRSETHITDFSSFEIMKYFDSIKRYHKPVI